MSTDGKTLKFRAAKLKGFTVYFEALILGKIMLNIYRNSKLEHLLRLQSLLGLIFLRESEVLYVLYLNFSF